MSVVITITSLWEVLDLGSKDREKRTMAKMFTIQKMEVAITIESNNAP